MDADPYSRIAEWYDLEHDALTADIECYAALISTLAGGQARVLEVGSGTGRVAAALALAGHQVTGVEPSAAMRDRCALRLAQLPSPVARRVSIVAGTADNLAPAGSEQFDIVLYGLNTFAHLTTARERTVALEAARSHLPPNGRLLLDLDVQGLARLRKAPGQVWWQGTWPLPAGGEVTHFIAAHEDTRPHVLSVQHFYDLSVHEGNVRRITSNMRLALLRRGLMERLLARTGFVVDALYGTYDLALYEDGAPRAIFVARPVYAASSGKVK